MSVTRNDSNDSSGSSKDDDEPTIVSPVTNALLRSRSKSYGRLTPLTVTDTLHTQHRRTDDIPMGFFTSQTLVAIHTSPPSEVGGDEAGTPSNQEVDMDDGMNKTPANRARMDSDTFRKTIDIVTCEKRIESGGDSEVSPIESDTNFSPMTDAQNKRRNTVVSLPPKHQSPVNSHKRLAFDVGSSSVRKYDTPNIIASASKPRNNPSRNLMRDFAEMNVIKSLQSLVKQQATPVGYEADNENTPGNTPLIAHTKSATPTTFESSRVPEVPRQSTFLQKSSSFLKALRRSGRAGRVLIQGWVAFREDDPWKDIVRNPRRCDFRYIVLLDDMPLLMIFRSRSRRQSSKLATRNNLLQDCVCLDLARDVIIGVDFVSKELGNEVCLINSESETKLFSLLPIPMPPNVFLDKHQSRLAKGSALKKVFPFRRDMAFATKDAIDRSSRATTWEQYDVARHLLFVLDCAIKYPLNGGSQNRRSLLYTHIR